VICGKEGVEGLRRRAKELLEEARASAAAAWEAAAEAFRLFMEDEEEEAMSGFWDAMTSASTAVRCYEELLAVIGELLRRNDAEGALQAIGGGERPGAAGSCAREER